MSIFTQAPKGEAGPAGPGPTIGDPVSGATNNCVLFVDGSGNLANDAGFSFLGSGSNQGVIVGDVNLVGAYGQLAVDYIYVQSAGGTKFAQLAADGTLYLQSAANVAIEAVMGATTAELDVRSTADIYAALSADSAGAVVEWHISGSNSTMILDATGLAINAYGAHRDITINGASLTIPSLAGVGSRAVVADANGVLSAP